MRTNQNGAGSAPSRGGCEAGPASSGRRRSPGMRALAVVAFAIGATRGAAAIEPPAEETLKAIAERGRAVAVAIQVTDQARDKLARQSQGIVKPNGVITYLDRGLWHIVFLQDPEAEPVPGLPRRGTMVVAETEYAEGADEVGNLRAMAPPRPATQTMVSYLRALRLAQTEAGSRSKDGLPLASAAFRERDGTFTVYLLPHGEPGGPAVFGADLVVRVMSSGRQVLSVEAAHATTTDVPLAGRSVGQPTLHTHASGDLPTPGDVALVRLHPSLAPHLVLTPQSMFRIDAAGAITYLGPSPVPVAAPGSPGAAPSAAPPPGPIPPPGGAPAGRGL